MGSINQFLKQLGTGDQIHDYQHASRIFVDDNYRLSPKYGFLFHVAFDINTEITRIPRDQMLEMGLVVKTAQLPKFTIDTKTFNAYNRPNIVQNKIKYDPLTITFHDDSADIIRDFWYDYYSYYYRDSDYQNSVYGAPSKYDFRQAQQWGYTPRQYPASAPGTQQFLRAIRIYSLHQKRFSEYTLINPTITSFRHGDHQNGANDTMQNEMSVQFEAVKYSYGYVSHNTVTGFADLHYDHTPSPLTPAGGGTNSILGPGGLLNYIDDITHDLSEGNLLGAAFLGLRGYQNFKNVNWNAMLTGEAQQIGRNVLTGNNPLAKISIPSLMGGVGLANAGVAGAKSLFGGIFSNGEKVQTGQTAPTSPTSGMPSTQLVGAQTLADGTVIQTYADGSQAKLDDEGNILSLTPAPATPPSSVYTNNNGEVVQVWGDGSSSWVSNGGEDNSVPEQTPVSPEIPVDGAEANINYANDSYTTSDQGNSYDGEGY